MAKAAEQADDDSWLIGFNWNHNVWQPAEYGTAEDLDRVSANHPVLLYAKSLHASWANSKALQAAGINQSTPDPVGGQILRDESGNPTGILLENAMQLAGSCQPTSDNSRTRRKNARHAELPAQPWTDLSARFRPL